MAPSFILIFFVLVLSSTSGFDFDFYTRNFSPRLSYFSRAEQKLKTSSCARRTFLSRESAELGAVSWDSIYYRDWTPNNSKVIKDHVDLFETTNKIAEELRKKTGLNPIDLSLDKDTYTHPLKLIENAGYIVEEVDVFTDSYILTLWRIPCTKKESESAKSANDCNAGSKRAVLIQHGLLMSGADWLYLESNSLPYMLAEANYDVYIGNARGNIYSRRHNNSDWNPNDPDSPYWKFSVHEMATIDLPATFLKIKAVRNNAEPMDYVGYSMGTTEFFIYRGEQGFDDPNIRRAVAIAPAAYIGNLKTPLKLLATVLKAGDKILPTLLLGLVQLLAANRDGPVVDQVPLVTAPAVKVSQYLAPLLVPPAGQLLANPNLCMLLCEGSPMVKNQRAFQLAMGHSPAGGSIRTVNHYIQLYQSNDFQRFQPTWNFEDLDPALLSRSPKDGTRPGKASKYTLKKQMSAYRTRGVPLLFIYGTDDSLTVPRDVLRTRAATDAEVCMKQNFNHLDFLLGPPEECKGVYEKVIKWFNMKGTEWSSTECTD